VLHALLKFGFNWIVQINFPFTPNFCFGFKHHTRNLNKHYS